MKRVPRRRAFTRTGVLASVIALGLLLIVLLPIIASMRERQRQQACIMRMKNLGVAIKHYHDNHQRFPYSAFYRDGQTLGKNQALLKNVVPGKAGTGNDRALYSFLVKLSPYVEQGKIYDSINFKQNEAFAPQNYTLAAKSVSAFICPSFSGKGTAEAIDYIPPAGVKKPALTNYKALGATTLACLQDIKAVSSPVLNGGIIQPYAPCSFVTVKSPKQTAVLSETKEQKYAAWWDGTTASIPGFHPGTGNIADDRTPSPPVAAPALNIAANGTQKSFITSAQFGGKEDMLWGPSSDHPGLVNHAMGGTEVRSISNDIDPIVYSALVSRRGDDNGALSNFFK